MYSSTQPAQSPQTADTNSKKNNRAVETIILPSSTAVLVLRIYTWSVVV